MQDGSGRHAFLGMGFVERHEAYVASTVSFARPTPLTGPSSRARAARRFDFNVTLQDHVKHLRREAAAEAAAEASAPPPQDFTLKGNLNIALPAGAAPKTRETPPRAGAAAAAPCGVLLPPPPGGATGGARRPVGGAGDSGGGGASAPTTDGAMADEAPAPPEPSWATF